MSERSAIARLSNDDRASMMSVSVCMGTKDQQRFRYRIQIKAVRSCRCWRPEVDLWTSLWVGQWGGLPYERGAMAEPPVGIGRLLAMCDQHHPFEGPLCAVFACNQ